MPTKMTMEEKMMSEKQWKRKRREARALETARERLARERYKDWLARRPSKWLFWRYIRWKLQEPK